MAVFSRTARPLHQQDFTHHSEHDQDTCILFLEQSAVFVDKLISHSSLSTETAKLDAYTKAALFSGGEEARALLFERARSIANTGAVHILRAAQSPGLLPCGTSANRDMLGVDVADKLARDVLGEVMPREAALAPEALNASDPAAVARQAGVLSGPELASARAPLPDGSAPAHMAGASARVLMTPAGVGAAGDVSVHVSQGRSVYLVTPALSATGASPGREGVPASRRIYFYGREWRMPGAGVKHSETCSPRTRLMESGAFMRRISEVCLVQDLSPPVRDSGKRGSRNVAQAAVKHRHNSKPTGVLSGTPSARPPSGLAGSSTSFAKRAKQVPCVYLDFATSASADRTPDGYNCAEDEENVENENGSQMELSGDGGSEGEFVDGNCSKVGPAGRPHEPGADEGGRKGHSPTASGSTDRRSKRI